MKYRTDLIKPPLGTDDVRYPNGNTANIMETVLFADTKTVGYTTKFAPTLKGETVYHTCQNIWRFLKTQIKYDLDPVGKQLVKSPGRFWKENKIGKYWYNGGDCKSFSIFTASCLKDLGIEYGYRFAAYEGNITPTHVYVYVPFQNNEIIIDAVWDGKFNTQKPFSKKIDYLRKRSAAIAGMRRTQNNYKGFLQY